MSIAVVTPWLSHPELYEDYADAIERGPAPDELIIVDNGSPEPLAFATLRLEENLGFSGGSNAGLETATSEIICFLNNDVIALRDHWLRDLAAAIETGVLVGPQLRIDEHADVDGEKFPYLDGWCIAGLRRELEDLGGFDATLEEPSYYSDNLLCLEARAAGFTLREVSIGLVHKGGRTTNANGYLLPSTIHNRAVYERRVRELVG